MALLAQDDRYLWDWSDLAGWPAVVVGGAMVGGGVQGALASERLGPAVAYSAMGATVFGGLGWMVGPSLLG